MKNNIYLILAILAASPLYIGAPASWPNSIEYYTVTAQVLPVLVLTLALQTSVRRRFMRQYVATYPRILLLGEQFLDLIDSQPKNSTLSFDELEEFAERNNLGFKDIEVLAEEFKSYFSALGRFSFIGFLTNLAIILAGFAEFGCLLVLFTEQQSPIAGFLMIAAIVLCGSLLINEMFHQASSLPEDVEKKANETSERLMTFGLRAQKALQSAMTDWEREKAQRTVERYEDYNEGENEFDTGNEGESGETSRGPTDNG